MRYIFAVNSDITIRFFVTNLSQLNFEKKNPIVSAEPLSHQSWLVLLAAWVVPARAHWFQPVHRRINNTAPTTTIHVSIPDIDNTLLKHCRICCEHAHKA